MYFHVHIFFEGSVMMMITSHVTFTPSLAIFCHDKENELFFNLLIRKNMKRLFCIPFHSYFGFGITGTTSLKNCVSQYGKCFCSVRAIQGIRREICFKPIFDSKKRKSIDTQKRFGSNTPSNISLMDYDVWLQPKIAHSFKDIYYFAFGLKYFDESFSLPEFKKCSVKALQVVTTLLSESRFSELDGLLTPECRKEIETNMTVNWTKSQTSVLAIDANSVTLSVPCDVRVYADKIHEEKSYAEIRVIYYAWMPYISDFNSDYQNYIVNYMVFNTKTNQKISMGVVFNCRFVREMTKGTDASWMINAINLRRLPGIFTTMESYDSKM